MAAVAASVFLTACGGADLNETERVAPLEASVESNPKKSTTKSSNEPIDPGGLEAPPPVTLHFLDQSIDLHAWTYCYRDGCVDGAPPPDPPNVGDPDEVVVEFPLPESSFKVSFSPAGEKCGRVQTVPLEVTDDGNFLLRRWASREPTMSPSLEGAMATSSQRSGGPHQLMGRSLNPRLGSPCSPTKTPGSEATASSWR